MHQQLIIEKISGILEATDDTYDVKLTEMLDNAKRIFISGAGRSKLVGNFFAMRLVHGGYDVSVVGEIVTPSIKSGDLLVIISGSGETEQLIAFTKSAQKVGAKIVLISAKSDSGKQPPRVQKVFPGREQRKRQTVSGGLGNPDDYWNSGEGTPRN
jgi:6-phospho 3-hexuloisomerase